jgi:dephospho-CoA kinase
MQRANGVKSTVAKSFAKLGIDVICSDSFAKKLTFPGQPAFKAIILHFGNALVLPSGELNRKLLRELIFKEEKERVWLENLLHPLIRNAIQEQIQTVKSPYCIIEIPLLYQKSDFPYLNTILVVTAPENLAISRVMQRDGCSKAEAEAILTLQKNKVQFEKIADDILVNAGDIADLEKDVEQLHRHYLRERN